MLTRLRKTRLWLLRRKGPSYASRLPGIWERIYQYHVRKTGGTSATHALCALAYDPDAVDLGETYGSGVPPHEMYPGRAVHMRVTRSPDRTFEGNGLRLVAGNLGAIAQGHYFYAHSHLPFGQVDLPPKTFRFTCLRDPVARVVSQYKMLVDLLRRNRLSHYGLQDLAPMLEAGFDSFVAGWDRGLLMHQLSTFSQRLDPGEATDRILELDAVLFTETLDADLALLGAKLELPLEPVHAKRSTIALELSRVRLHRLRELLEAEYEVFERVRRALGRADA